MYFCYFVIILLDKGVSLHLKKMNMLKVYRRTERQTTDDRWTEKLTWDFISGELKTIVVTVLKQI